MIDFQNGSVFKLKQTDTQSVMPLVEPLLIDGEQVISAYKSVRDCVIFTDKRVIAVNVQGILCQAVRLFGGDRRCGRYRQ